MIGILLGVVWLGIAIAWLGSNIQSPAKEALLVLSFIGGSIAVGTGIFRMTSLHKWL